MKIAVCIKQIPDTEAKIAVKADGSGIVEDGLKYVTSPYDEYAIEEALKTKEAKGGEVIAIAVGPQRIKAALSDALALGADRAILCQEDSDNLTPLGIAKILAKIIQDEEISLVFCGKEAGDQSNSQTPQMLAELLAAAAVSAISAFKIEGETLELTRDIEGGGQEITKASLPAVISTNKGLNQPRFKSVRGIMAAKKKEIKQLSVADLGISDLNQEQTKLKYLAYNLPPERKAGEKIAAETAAEAADKLVQLLRNQAKII